MGNSAVLYIVVVIVALAGLFGTLLVGRSRENREGNPKYDRATRPNWLRLGALYIIGGAVMVATFIWFLRQ